MSATCAAWWSADGAERPLSIQSTDLGYLKASTVDSARSRRTKNDHDFLGALRRTALTIVAAI
jgi:hypothetical protein